jgi:hypothetical protein
MIKKIDTLANRLSYAMKMQNVGVCELQKTAAVIDTTFEKIRKAAP